MALKEQHKSRRIRITVDGKTATREWVCNWTEKDTLGPRVGDMYPDETDPQLFVQDIEQQPEGHATGESGYTKCRIIAHYTTRNPQKPIFSLDASYEALETAHGRTWASDSTTCRQRIPITHKRGEMVVDRVFWFMPTGMIFELVDCINLFPFLGCPSGTIRFDGMTGRTEYTNLGESVWRGRLRFIYRPWPGWNYIWRQDIGDWDTFTTSLYLARDLGVLLL